MTASDHKVDMKKDNYYLYIFKVPYDVLDTKYPSPISLTRQDVELLGVYPKLLESEESIRHAAEKYGGDPNMEPEYIQHSSEFKAIFYEVREKLSPELKALDIDSLQEDHELYYIRNICDPESAHSCYRASKVVQALEAMHSDPWRSHISVRVPKCLREGIRNHYASILMRDDWNFDSEAERDLYEAFLTLFIKMLHDE